MMKIEGRKKKIESEKMIQILKMYNIFLEYGTVYDFELGLDCSKEKDQATFRRYANELHQVGAIPKVKLKKEIIESGNKKEIFHYYAAPGVKLVQRKPDGYVYVPQVGKKLPVFNPRKAFQQNAYHRFRIPKRPAKRRLARLLCYEYWMRAFPPHSKGEEYRTRYEKLNPGASEKTYQRDRDLLLLARFAYLDYDPIEDREMIPEVYKRYLRSKSNQP